jgi:beta-lactam-binding protein with PASTA domain
MTSPASLMPKQAKQAAAPVSSASPTRPTKVTMPRVTDQNGAAAEAKLKTLGFEEITFGSADDSARVVLLPQNWKVTRQDPRPGARVDPRSTTVVLTMVKLS